MEKKNLGLTDETIPSGYMDDETAEKRPRASFSPSLKGYRNFPTFRHFVSMVMPSVFDDSLSYLELLTKVVKHLNSVIEDMRAAEENVDALATAYDQLEGFVNDYFQNLDVQDEIDNKLDRLVQDEEFLQNFKILVTPVISEEADAWLEEHLGEGGSTLIERSETAAELAQSAANAANQATTSAQTATSAALAAANNIAEPFDETKDYSAGDYVLRDGKIYVFANEHVAGTWDDTDAVQVKAGEEIAALKVAIDTIYPTPELTWILRRNVDGVGNISTNNYMAVTDAVPVSTGDVIIRKTLGVVNNRTLIGYLSEFNDITFIRRSTFNIYDQKFTITDPNITHIRIAFGRTSSSGVEISQSDVDNYFRVSIFKFNIFEQAAANNIAKPFDETKEYNAGDYALHDDKIYVFVNGHDAGSWDDTDAVQVRAGEEISVLKTAIDTICPTAEATWILKYNVDGVGNISANNYMAVTDPIPVNAGDTVIRKTPSYVDSHSILGYVSEFNDNTFIRRSYLDKYNQAYVITDTNTTHIRVAFGRITASGIEVSQSDVDKYFKFNIFSQAVTDLNGLANRGNISALGLTSIGQCKKQGYYTFGSNDTLSDLPIGWSGGGLVLVYRNNSVIWQRLISNKYRFNRYGTSAQWRNESDLVYVQYIAEAGENQSDAKLNIFIPRDTDNRRTLYQMGHCIDESVNADVWRIMFMYRVDTNGTQRKLTMTGEWECAVHLADRTDFSGGIVHGDEIDTDIQVFVDGTLTNISSLNMLCNELKIIRHSNLYDPNDSTVVIAEHGIEYVYTTDGLKINQSIRWMVSASLTNCYLAMLPIIKLYSKYRYDDTSFLITENNQNNYKITIPDAKSITEYSTDYDCTVTMAITSYPTGLTGGDCALITDNGGLNYNKMYFPVCTSGISQIGDIWKSTTVFKNR